MAPPTENFLHDMYGESSPAALLLLISTVLLSISFLVFCSFFKRKKRNSVDLSENGEQKPELTLTRVTVRMSPKQNGVAQETIAETKASKKKKQSLLKKSPTSAQNDEKKTPSVDRSSRALPSLPEMEKTSGGQPIEGIIDPLYDTLYDQPIEEENPDPEIEEEPLVLQDSISINKDGDNAKTEIERQPFEHQDSIPINKDGEKAKNQGAKEVKNKDIEGLYSKVGKKSKKYKNIPPVPETSTGDVMQTEIIDKEKVNNQEAGIPRKTSSESLDKLLIIYKNASKRSPNSNLSTVPDETLEKPPSVPEKTFTLEGDLK